MYTGPYNLSKGRDLPPVLFIEVHVNVPDVGLNELIECDQEGVQVEPPQALVQATLLLLCQACCEVGGNGVKRLLQGGWEEWWEEIVSHDVMWS